MQLPIQAQSNYFVEDWEKNAGNAEMLAVAQTADASGFFYIGVCDHVAIPDELVPAMGAIWYDTIATLGWLAGQTTRTRLLSTVFNLTYRAPLVTANSFATLDNLSDGRAIIGVGAGHVEKEFNAVGADYARRGKATDEALQVLDVALSTGSYDGLAIEPRAVQSPRPPIWVGGGAPAAVRRAGKLADGWLPQGTPLDQMPALVEIYREERAAAGKSGDGDIGAISPWVYVGEPLWDLDRPAAVGSAEKIAEELRTWSAVGVNHLQVRFPSRSVEELVDQVAAFGTTVGPLL
jgi:probable F420-dependent oxidoreductase